ncbi:hypothetical protein GTGU_01230 [Trabulsiella guamensis ATCC 49490]|uniref:Uncharacterized protein n=1 Tax=Trabulsiella guamensis ATCC 49490 TaxID=1005994 RepID=A0A085AFP3_9ENTR|nr:hypothetical protein [Trabulsiella guamensis]KFC09038.1 hypothetical protein GTGU_01230 [Trabulsiella guamensis ATCC 49490]
MNKSLMPDSEAKERWIITRDNDHYYFVREINGVVEESYAPVSRPRATVFAAAIIQGFEPPGGRKLHIYPGGFVL